MQGTHTRGRTPRRQTHSHAPRGLRPTRSTEGEVTMTAKLSFSLNQPIARGRIRMLALATAVALATVAALGAATGRAAAGSVYFDNNNNAAAGDPSFLFNATF